MYSCYATKDASSIMLDLVYYIPGYSLVYPLLLILIMLVIKIFIFKLYVLFRIETYTFLPLYPPGYLYLLLFLS